MNGTDPEVLSAAISHLQYAPRTLASREDCALTWQALVEHRLSIVGTALTGDCAHLVLRDGPTQAGAAPLSARNLQVLEKMLVGVGRKVLGADLGISASTIAQILKQALVDMGLSCPPARVPPLLAVLLHAAQGATSLRLSLSSFEQRGRRVVVISGEIESDAARALAPAVRAVLRERLVGKSHADIAHARRTSPRTVANQIAAATHQLGVSGRFDLLRFMATAR